jgi:hypothetical protein
MPRKGPDPRRILFIGNSFTARNDLPGMIARLAQARGHAQEHRLISRGGASLRMHWNKGDAPREIEHGRYDVVVLQEQSTLPVKNAERMKENVRLFDAAIRAAGARTALYMTWSRRQAPQSQRAITDAYTSIGQELGALVVPVGVAWHACLGKHEKPDLYDKDGSHPSLAGSYLAACVFLSALYEASPDGIDVEVKGLPPADATRLQNCARDALR